MALAEKRICEHTDATTISSADEFIVDSMANGTRNITMTNLESQILSTDTYSALTGIGDGTITGSIVDIDSNLNNLTYDSNTNRLTMTGNTAFSGTIDSSPTAGSGNAVSSGGTKTYVDSAVSQLNAEIDAINQIFTFSHFVQIPFTTGVLESIKAAFENATIPVDLFGITFGIVRGNAGSQRVVVIAQNQRLSTTQTRYAAIYFGAYTAPRFLQKQDGTDWTDVAL